MRERQHGFILCFVQLKWEEVQTEARFVHLAGVGRGARANDEGAKYLKA